MRWQHVDAMNRLALPHATLSEYERAGHFVYLDEPERFTAEVTAFLLARR